VEKKGFRVPRGGKNISGLKYHPIGVESKKNQPMRSEGRQRFIVQEREGSGSGERKGKILLPRFCWTSFRIEMEIGKEGGTVVRRKPERGKIKEWTNNIFR